MAIQVVSFRCTLKDTLGRIISSTVNQNVLNLGSGKLQSMTALVDALHGLRKGEKRKVSLRANEAYGYYDPELVLVRPTGELTMSEPVKLGERVIYVRNGKSISYWVTQMSGETVTLDGNHPLAGQDLVFELEGMESRDATAKEIADSVPEAMGSSLLH